MRKYIQVSDMQREMIMKVFKVGKKSVYNALNYDPRRGGTDTARRIRQMARKQGAHTYYVVRGEEALFDSEGNWHQIFENGAEIHVDKASGIAQLIYRGERRQMIENARVSDIAALQNIAKGL